MARPAGSIFEAGTAVLFDLDNTLIDRDRARDRNASLLTGDQVVVDQGFMPRDLDGMVFKYVGAAGVDQARIVQVGVAAPQDSDAP